MSTTTYTSLFGVHNLRGLDRIHDHQGGEHGDRCAGKVLDQQLRELTTTHTSVMETTLLFPGYPDLNNHTDYINYNTVGQ